MNRSIRYFTAAAAMTACFGMTVFPDEAKAEAKKQVQLQNPISMLVVDTDKNGTNVRETPRGKIIATIPYAAKNAPDKVLESRQVEVLGQDGDWFKIRFDGEREGYMHKSVLGTCASATEDGNPTFYAEPKDGGKTVGKRIPEGSFLRLEEVAAGDVDSWARFSLAGKDISGWLMPQATFSNPFSCNSWR